MAAKVRVRFAPSPTGDPHIGSVWAAMFNWLYAKHTGGTFILRIEDTDQKRLVPGSQEKIYQALEWYSLIPDEGPVQGGPYAPYVQSQRLEIYRAHAEKLLATGKAYYCFCSAERLDKLRADQAAQKQPPKYDKLCATSSPEESERRRQAGEPSVVRLKLPATGTIEHTDLIRGTVTFRYDQQDDCVLMKTDGFPTYHLANVVDDHLMEITHVIRAEEWLPSVPKHLYLYQSFGWDLPQFAHLPLLLGQDRSKLAKRHGATSALSFQDEGYLPEAMRNFMVLMGWHPKGDRETLSLEEIIKDFDLADINPSGAIFDRTKLDWFNGFYIRQLNSDDLLARSEPFIKLPGWNEQGRDRKIAALNLVRERLHRLSEIDPLLLFSTPEGWNQMLAAADLNLINHKKIKPGDGSDALKWSIAMIDKLEHSWTAAALRDHFIAEIKTAGRSNMSVLWPLRFCLSLAAASPDVFDVMELIGAVETKRRIKTVIKQLGD